MSKKRYPDGFKIEADKQVVDAGDSVADVAGRLGMTTHSLYALPSRNRYFASNSQIPAWQWLSL